MDLNCVATDNPRHYLSHLKRVSENAPSRGVASDYQPLLSSLSPTTPRQQCSTLATALEMCTQTLWHTLETTTIVLPDGDTFIHTGDIDDLWLRDGFGRANPFSLHPFLDSDPRLDRVVSGLIQRSSKYIRHDPYACLSNR
jgi:meiotically up-regulated gene 157 (Mug157) protein